MGTWGHKRDMGRVRNKTVKRSSKKVIERYYQRLTLDFNTNKRICDEVAMIPSKRLRNKIAGFTTHMMKRIARGPVKGISLKLQEEEREKRLDYIPDISAVDLMIEDGIEIDTDTKNMLRNMDMQNLLASMLYLTRIVVHMVTALLAATALHAHKTNVILPSSCMQRRRWLSVTQPTLCNKSRAS